MTSLFAPYIMPLLKTAAEGYVESLMFRGIAPSPPMHHWMGARNSSLSRLNIKRGTTTTDDRRAFWVRRGGGGPLENKNMLYHLDLNFETIRARRHSSLWTKLNPNEGPFQKKGKES